MCHLPRPLVTYIVKLKSPDTAAQTGQVSGDFTIQWPTRRTDPFVAYPEHDYGTTFINCP